MLIYIENLQFKNCALPEYFKTSFQELNIAASYKKKKEKHIENDGDLERSSSIY